MYFLHLEGFFRKDGGFCLQILQNRFGLDSYMLHGIYDNKICAIVEKHRAEKQPTLALHVSMSIHMRMIELPYGG